MKGTKKDLLNKDKELQSQFHSTNANNSKHSLTDFNNTTGEKDSIYFCYEKNIDKMINEYKTRKNNSK